MPTLSIAELSKELKKEEIKIDYDNIPEEFSGGGNSPLELGTYTFEFPKSVEEGWEIVNRKIRGEDAQRIQYVAGRDNPLVVVSGGAGTRNGEPFQTRISNAERNRSKKGEPEVFASDMNYLLVALGSEAKPKTNMDYINAFKKVAAGARFSATVEWQGYCNQNRQAYVNLEDAEGNPLGNGPWVNSDGTPHMGCGNRMYNKAYRQADGKYVPNATCPQCGASVRPFAQLRNFGPAKSK